MAIEIRDLSAGIAGEIIEILLGVVSWPVLLVLPLESNVTAFYILFLFLLHNFRPFPPTAKCWLTNVARF